MLAAQLALHTWLWSAGHGEATAELVGALLEEGQRRDEVRSDAPAEQMAELFLAIMLVTIRNWLINKDEEALDERLVRAWRILRDGAMSAQSSADPAPTAAAAAKTHRPRPLRSRSKR